jgi:hypothetical protein
VVRLGLFVALIAGGIYLISSFFKKDWFELFECVWKLELKCFS